MPAFAVIDGRIGDPMKAIRALAHDIHHSHGPGIIIRAQLRAVHFVIQLVQVLPHLRTDLFAHLARIFARSADALGDGEHALRFRHQQK